MNVRGWGVGKCDDVYEEMRSHEVTIMGVVETQMRGKLDFENDEYIMIGKGRSKQVRKGGGVGIILRKNKGVEMEEIESGDKAMDEDIIIIMIVKLEIESKNECLILIVCYMTVEGEHAREENEIKYNCLKKWMEKFENEEVLIMGDMNGHIGILNERVNANGGRLLKFMDEADMENLNATMADGKVTWRTGEYESAIDYVLVNEIVRRNIRKMVIDEEGEWDVNTDHNVIWIELYVGKRGKNETVKSVKKRCKWRLNNVNWEEFQGELDGNAME